MGVQLGESRAGEKVQRRLRAGCENEGGDDEELSLVVGRGAGCILHQLLVRSCKGIPAGLAGTVAAHFGLHFVRGPCVHGALCGVHGLGPRRFIAWGPGRRRSMKATIMLDAD